MKSGSEVTGAFLVQRKVLLANSSHCRNSATGGVLQITSPSNRGGCDETLRSDHFYALPGPNPIGQPEGLLFGSLPSRIR